MRCQTLLLGLFFAPIVAVWMPSITVIQVLTLTLMFIGVLSFATAAKRVWVITSRLDRSAGVNRLDRSASMNRLDRSASTAPGELLEQHGHGT